MSTRLLGVGDVLARYGLRDRRAVRRVMDEAGAFVVATKLYVRESDLVDYEERLRSARARRQSPAPPRGRRAQPAPRRSPTAPQEPLAPGWWREPAP
jgi:hypothetical protein